MANAAEDIKVKEYHFKSMIEELPTIDYWTEHDKYQRVAKEYAIIVEILAEKYPTITLQEIEPVTKLFRKYQDDYFEGEYNI